jgi:Raf kinase inhibitor-like YbhB/YbcL family protein
VVSSRLEKEVTLLDSNSLSRGFAIVFAVVSFACSSDDSSTTSSTGPTTTSTGQGGSGGSAGSGSSSTTASGGAGAGGSSTGSAGATTGGGNAGSAGSGGSAGSAGSGGAGGGTGGGKTDGGAGSGGAMGDGGPREGGMSDATSAFHLTSPAFTEGQTIPAANTCAGANTSPELDWTAGPAGTLSYAIIFTDKNNMLRHWAIWDIPATTTSLQANLPKMSMPAMPAGAKQVSFSGMGYAGPCPGANEHTYEFAVYAVNVASLPGTSTTPSQMAAQNVETIVLPRQIAKATLSGHARTQ